MDFERDGYSFRVEKLNAFGQLHLSRKVAPLLPTLAPVMMKWMRSKSDLLSSQILDMAELAEPFCEQLAVMRDEDAEAIMTMALGSVKVCTDVGKNVWIPLWIPGAKSASVMELNDLGKLLPIVTKVIAYNLGNFIDGLLTSHGKDNPGSSGERSPTAKIGS